MKLAIVGPSQSGKDSAGTYLSQAYPLRFTGSCSTHIAPVVASRLGITIAEATANRHRDKAIWREVGDELREHDPAALARLTLAEGDLCVGVRSLREIRAARAEGLVSLIAWIDRDVPWDETLEYGSEECDIVIPNRWDLPAFHARLDRLAGAMGLVRPTSAIGR